MKIVILADAWQPITGGGQKLFLELVTRLVRDHRCQIQVITRALKHKSKIYHQEEKSFNHKLIITRLGPPAQWSNLLARIWFTIQSSFYALKLKPDIYLASTFLPAISLKIISLLKSTPNTLITIGLSGENSFLERFITQKLNYDLIITDDITYFNQMKSQRNIKIITNGVDLPKLKSSKKWPHFTFLFVGRMDKRKGVNFLIKAFAKVVKTHPQVKLRLVGDGDQLQAYKHLATKILPSENYRFLGQISDKQKTKEYHQAHCFVLPAIWEGHPLVVFEAFAHKLPVIATKVGSLSKFITSDTGFLVKPKNSDDLAKTMNLNIKNQYLKVLGKNGYQLVAKNYSWGKTTKQYHQALATLLRQ